MKPVDGQNKVIVALDVNSREEALDIVHDFGSQLQYYKVGYQLFLRQGMTIVNALLELDKRVFLDLKMGDIGNTMRAGLDAIPGEVAMLTIQGNLSVCQAAVNALQPRQPRPKILLLTALSTSIEDDPSVREKHILNQCQLALDSGCDGVIASGTGVGLAYQLGAGRLHIVAPGIRLTGGDRHEQRHVLSPAQAIAAGANQLVIGRALTQAADRKRVLEEILQDISSISPVKTA